jgi:hypothetical protein
MGSCLKRVGDHHLVPQCGVYDRLTPRIPADLPDHFIIKVTHGCKWHQIEFTCPPAGGYVATTNPARAARAARLWRLDRDNRLRYSTAPRSAAHAA